MVDLFPLTVLLESVLYEGSAARRPLSTFKQTNKTYGFNDTHLAVSEARLNIIEKIRNK